MARLHKVTTELLDLIGDDEKTEAEEWLYSPGLHAARSLMTSLAHGLLCEACHAGGPSRVVPGIRSTCSTNFTRGAQHVGLRTSAHMGTHAFQIHSTQFASILAVCAPVWYQAPSVLTPAPDHANTRAWAVGKIRNGSRTRRPAEPPSVSEITTSVTRPTSPVC